MKNKYIPSGLHLERNKFRLSKEKEDRALDIFRIRNIELYEDFIGMSLTLAQNKALLAIQGIQNIRKDNANPTHLKFTRPEYFEAYGVGKNKRKGGLEYNYRESKLALKALASLADNIHQFFYKRVHWVGDKKKEENRRTSYRAFLGSLITIDAGFSNLKNSEAEALRGGKWSRAKTEKRADIEITLSKIITDQLQGYYVLIPSSLFDDVKQTTKTITDEKGKKKKARSNKYIPLFLEWLIVEAELKRRNKDFSTKIEIHQDKLARTLRMDYWIKTHRVGKIEAMLKQCFDVAYQKNYLSNAYINEEKICELTLNPEEYPYWHEEMKRTQELWHQKEYKRKKLIEKRLKY